MGRDYGVNLWRSYRWRSDSFCFEVLWQGIRCGMITLDESNDHKIGVCLKLNSGIHNMLCVEHPLQPPSNLNF